MSTIYDLASGPMQTGGFKLHVTNGAGVETMVYDNTGVAYGDGVVTVPLSGRDVTSVRITRPEFDVITLCEVEVYMGMINF